MSQHQQYAPPPELHTVPVSLSRKQHEPDPDYNEGKGLIRYSRIKVLEPGGEGGARVEKLEPHVEMLSEHIRGSLAVPGENQGPRIEVTVLLDSGSGVTVIIEALVRRLEVQLPGTQVRCPFEGSARVMCAFGTEGEIKTQTCPLHLALGAHGGRCGSPCHLSFYLGSGTL